MVNKGMNPPRFSLQFALIQIIKLLAQATRVNALEIDTFWAFKTACLYTNLFFQLIPHHEVPIMDYCDIHTPSAPNTAMHG